MSVQSIHMNSNLSAEEAARLYIPQEIHDRYPQILQWAEAATVAEDTWPDLEDVLEYCEMSDAAGFAKIRRIVEERILREKCSSPSPRRHK